MPHLYLPPIMRDGGFLGRTTLSVNGKTSSICLLRGKHTRGDECQSIVNAPLYMRTNGLRAKPAPAVSRESHLAPFTEREQIASQGLLIFKSSHRPFRSGRVANAGQREYRAGRQVLKLTSMAFPQSGIDSSPHVQVTTSTEPSSKPASNCPSSTLALRFETPAASPRFLPPGNEQQHI